jgi:hypothetical protein
MYYRIKNKIINKNRKEKYQSGGLIIDEDELRDGLLLLARTSSVVALRRRVSRRNICKIPEITDLTNLQDM